MRKNLILGAAVTAALASTGASAANVDIYVTGSSALRSFFIEDLGVNICGFTSATYKANLATANYLDTAYTAYAPDFTAFQCTAQATANGVNSGDVVTMHYAAEFGSVMGVFTAYTPTFQRRFLTPNAAGCPAGSYTVPGKTATQAGLVWPTLGSTSYCTATGYNHVTDTETTDPNNILTASTADIVVSDVEPALFNADHWPNANFDATLRPTAVGSAPTAAQIATATGVMSVMNGQVFSVIAHSLPGTSDTQTNISLSRSSLRSILTGKVTKWNQVPEFAQLDTATTSINICRRDHGSGTGLSADIAFAGQACSLDGASAVKTGTTTTYPGTAPWVYEAPASSDMKACVSSTAGTIGILVNAAKDANFSYTVILVDGYQPNAHNAAAGLYPYAFENWAGVLANNPGGGNAAATSMLTRAKSFSALTTAAFANETGALTGGSQWIGTAVNAVYSIKGVDGNILPTTQRNARQWVADPLPESMFSRSGDSCKVVSSSSL
jgi:hypothetical protein